MRADLRNPFAVQKQAAKCGLFETVEKHRFSNSLSIGTTLPIEFADVCARPAGTLAIGLYSPVGLYPYSAAVRRFNESKPRYMAQATLS